MEHVKVPEARMVGRLVRNAHIARHKHGQEHEHTVLKLKQEVVHLWRAGPVPLAPSAVRPKYTGDSAPHDWTEPP